MEKMMKAVVLDKPTKGEEVVLSEIAVPEVKPGWVLVKVKAFGMNHSEAILREFEIENDYIQKPIIPGIECVGEIEDPSDSGWKKGQKRINYWCAERHVHLDMWLFSSRRLWGVPWSEPHTENPRWSFSKRQDVMSVSWMMVAFGER